MIYKTEQQVIDSNVEGDEIVLGENNVEKLEKLILQPKGKNQESEKIGLLKKIETFIGKLSTKNNFWNKVCSLIWLPFAFSSGLIMTKDENEAILPFRRFNKNWYNAMAGAILLGNSEIAGGTYVFKKCNGFYRVVCKKLEYRFLRPCIGPALYKMTPREDIEKLIATGSEFNIDLDITISQLMHAPTEKHRKVGKCAVTFHATPIASKNKKVTTRQLSSK